MTPEEEVRALSNVERVRKHAKYVQVMPDPHCADNVQLRTHGSNIWRTLHVLAAMTFVRNTRRRLRRTTPAPR